MPWTSMGSTRWPATVHTTVDGLTIVAPSQAAADLLTGSGRMPSEGEELLDWMKDNERVWRT